MAGNPIFVGGVPRSGTTLLRVILDTHPQIFCGTELRAVEALARLAESCRATCPAEVALPYSLDEARIRAVFGRLIMDFLEPSWRASGKARVAEKTPSNLVVFPELRRLFPESALIHMIRDGRDVVASRLERDRAELGPGFDSVEMAGLRAIEWAAAMQFRRRLLGDEQVSRAYFEVRYEALVARPEAVLRPLFEFVGEGFDPVVLSFATASREVEGVDEWSAGAVRRPIFANSIGRWREALGRRELAAVLDVAAAELEQLGYGVAQVPA
jgi:hypothetical protein